MHLYTISNEERMGIRHSDTILTEDINRVGPFMLPGYVPTMEIVPMMGMHWIDPNSAEFNGKILTHTMIMGSHKDKVAFLNLCLHWTFC